MTEPLAPELEARAREPAARIAARSAPADVARQVRFVRSAELVCGVHARNHRLGRRSC